MQKTKSTFLLVTSVVPFERGSLPLLALDSFLAKALLARTTSLMMNAFSFVVGELI